MGAGSEWIEEPSEIFEIAHCIVHLTPATIKDDFVKCSTLRDEIVSDDLAFKIQWSSVGLIW